jgi:hypothetical protein
MSYTLRFNRDGEDKNAIVNIRVYGKKKTFKISLLLTDLTLALMVKNDPVPCKLSIEIPKKKK